MFMNYAHLLIIFVFIQIRYCYTYIFRKLVFSQELLNITGSNLSYTTNNYILNVYLVYVEKLK
jgi:hypothetical protein